MVCSRMSSYSEQKAEDLFLGRHRTVSDYERSARDWAEHMVHSDAHPRTYKTTEELREVARHRLILMATSKNPDIRNAVASKAIDVFNEALGNPHGRRSEYAAESLRMLSNCSEEICLAMVAKKVIGNLVNIGRRSVTSAESVAAMGTLHHLTCGKGKNVILEVLRCGGVDVFLNFIHAKQMGHYAFAGLAHLVVHCSDEEKLNLAKDRGAIDMCVKAFRTDRFKKTGNTSKLNAIECIRNFICDARQDVIDILYEKQAIQILLDIAKYDNDPMFLRAAIQGLYFACVDGDDEFKQMLVAKHDLVGIMKFHVLNNGDDKIVKRAVQVFAGLASGGEVTKSVLLENGLIESLLERAEYQYKNDYVKYAQAVGVVLLNMSKTKDDNNIKSFLERGAKGLAVRTQVYLVRRAAATVAAAATTKYYIDQSKQAVSNISTLEKSQREIEKIEAGMQMMHP